MIRTGGSMVLGGYSPSYWSARRAKVVASIYPNGLLTTLPDSQAAGVDYDLPSECASAIRYIATSPGGRDGGTAAYADLWLPTAASANKCLVFFSGHGDGDAEACAGLLYCSTDGASIIKRMMARGWMVLAVDLPAYGVQPRPQKVFVAGAEQSYTTHAYSAMFGDGGPSPNRLYLDHVIRSMNAIGLAYPGVRFSLAGHSGGGAVAAMLGVVENRFSAIHLMQWASYQAAGASSEIESWSGNAAMVAALGCAENLGLLAAAVPGRATVMHSAPQDEYVASSFAGLQRFAADSSVQLSWSGGPTLAFNSKNTPWAETPYGTPYHTIDQVQAAYVEAHLVANG